MERELSFVIYNALQRTFENGVPFEMDIYEFGGGDGWRLEVATEDGTPIGRENSRKLTEPYIKSQLATFALKPAMIGTPANLQIISKPFSSEMLNKKN